MNQSHLRSSLPGCHGYIHTEWYPEYIFYHLSFYKNNRHENALSDFFKPSYLNITARCWYEQKVNREVTDGERCLAKQRLAFEQLKMKVSGDVSFFLFTPLWKINNFFQSYSQMNCFYPLYFADDKPDPSPSYKYNFTEFSKWLKVVSYC